jgi:hypothetical protein
MSARTYPYDGWVLLPSFKLKKVTFVKNYGAYSGDHGDITDSGKYYQLSQIHALRSDALIAGHNQLNLQQARLDKQLAVMAKRRAALIKEES